MKRKAILKIILFVFIFLQGIIISYSQNFKNFEPRYNNKSLHGDIFLIGNNIMNRSNFFQGPNVPYHGISGNGLTGNRYIDIDQDLNTFNSSSAHLALPVPVSDQACTKIVYAGLYWGAATKGPSATEKVKLKLPGNNNYIDIEGSVIYQATSGVGSAGNMPYVCYADVTSHFSTKPYSDFEGDYTVANVSGRDGGVNMSAGWHLFFVYENLDLPKKAITSFDGFSSIDENNNLDIAVSGFTTILTGPVRANFAFSAIEGDRDIGGDYLAINGVKMLIQERPARVPVAVPKGDQPVIDNFFNSSITSLGTQVTSRIPNSSNTLGFDAGVFEIDNPINAANPGGSVIKNGDNSAVISLASALDLYFYYFNAFAVDIIAPEIVLVKKVKKIDFNTGNEVDARNQYIGFDTEVKYEIQFQNKGNDDAVNFTITDILPKSVVFDETKDILELPPGVTMDSYNKDTRTIVFNIDPVLVQKQGALYVIKFRVKTPSSCYDLIDACSNVVKNTATSKYNGVVNSEEFGEASFWSEPGCTVMESESTDFYIDISKCRIERTLYLCGPSIKLKAGSGHSSYIWKNGNGVVFGETTKKLL